MIKYMSLSISTLPPPNPIPVNMGSYSLPTNADQINLKCWPIAIAEYEKKGPDAKDLNYLLVIINPMAITAMIRTSSPIVRPKIEPILDGVQLQNS